MRRRAKKTSPRYDRNVAASTRSVVKKRMGVHGGKRKKKQKARVKRKREPNRRKSKLKTHNAGGKKKKEEINACLDRELRGKRPVPGGKEKRHPARGLQGEKKEEARKPYGPGQLERPTPGSRVKGSDATCGEKKRGNENIKQRV